jgi:hypothetical protein
LVHQPSRTPHSTALAAVQKAPMNVSGLNRAAAGMPVPSNIAVAAPAPAGLTAGQRALATAIRDTDRRHVERQAEEARLEALRAQKEKEVRDRIRPATAVTGERSVQPPRAQPPADTSRFTAADTSLPPPARSAFAPLPGSRPQTAATASGRLGGLAASIVAGTRTPGASPLTTRDVKERLRVMHSAAATQDSQHALLRDADQVARVERKRAAIERDDEAFKALDNIRAVEVTAFQCATCAHWSLSRPQRCVAEGHKVTAAKTVKRYYRCRNCHYNLQFLTGNGLPFKVDCPRCHARGDWAEGSAANIPKERRVDQHGDAIPDEEQPAAPEPADDELHVE